MGNRIIRALDKKLILFDRWLFGPPSEAVQRRNLLMTRNEWTRNRHKSKNPVVHAMWTERLLRLDQIERMMDEAKANKTELNLKVDFFGRLGEDTEDMDFLLDPFEQSITLAQYQVRDAEVAKQTPLYDEEEEYEKLVNILPSAPIGIKAPIQREPEYFDHL